ncbi:hypothetical protein [Mesoplasma photuris]|uniref:hypothetical protein n=1 Tax=Mesoplasma photuris TaxID=217731 RepID=UPI0004E15FD5|nr:hypothetical protein [Mesoplasma photuris]
MNNNQTLKQLLVEVLIKTSIDKIYEKSLEIKTQFNDSGMADNPMVAQFLPKTDEINEYTTELVNQINQINTFENLVNLLKNNAVNIAGMMNGSMDQAQLMSMMMSGGGFGKTMLKMQFGSIFSTIQKAVVKTESIMNKLGADELLSEIDADDLDYLLNSALKSEINAIREFLIRNPHDAANIVTEFATLEDAKSWDKKYDSIKAIEKYFAVYKQQDMISEVQTMSDISELQNSEAGAKLQNYADAIVNVHSISILITLAKSVFKKMNK